MTSIESNDSHAGVGELEAAAHDLHLRVRVMLVEVATTWAVQQGLQLGYRRMTGRAMPSALDPDVPLRKILTWAAISAAAVAVAHVSVDRIVLRPNRSRAPR